VNDKGWVARDAEPRAVWQGRFADRRFVINVIGTLPWLIAHARIGEFLEITSFDQSPALLDFRQQRRAGAANQIQQPDLFQFRVAKPQRAGSTAPATEVETGLSVIE